MYNRPYRPDFIILCYDIGSRASLVNLQQLWWRKMVEWFMQDRDEIPVMVLGLKRDLRVEGEGTIYPQEGHRIAGELRCDMYGECSAVTGELMSEVFEDVARRAARTTTQKGGLSDGTCGIM